jgi:hemoglobin
VLSSLFTERRPQHVDHLTWFTAESFGGPDRFTRELGFQHVIDVHRHLKITDEQRERFVAVYMESLDEAGLPNDEPFRKAVRSHVEFGSRVAQQNSWAETDADLHPIRNIPRWQWPAITQGEPEATGIDAGAVLTATEAWKRAFPGAVAGALTMRGVRNPERSATLEANKRRLEEQLRDAAEGSEGGGPGADRVLNAYLDYYRAHGKTYHVKAQWESVARKGKPIPRRAALVEAMFMAELKNLILTAAHDLAAIELPLHVDVSGERDRYVLMNGAEQAARAGDMMMVDGKSIVSTVLYGPDRRTRITPETTEVLFAAYAPAGIGDNAVRDHLEDIRANVLLVVPEAETGPLVTLPAS